MIPNTEKYQLKFHFVISLILAFSLPHCDYTHVKFATFVIIALTANWLFLGSIKQKILNFRANQLWFSIFMLLYLIPLIGLWHTENLRDGLNRMEHKLILIVLPLIYATSKSFSPKQIDALLSTFTTSMFLVSLWTYREGILFLIQGNYELQKIADLLLIHRVYFGMYLGLVLFFLVSVLARKIDTWKKVIAAIGLLYFLFFLVMIRAKMAWFSITLSGAITIILFLHQQRKWRFLVVFYVLAALISLGIYFQSKTVRTFVSKFPTFEGVTPEDIHPDLIHSLNIRIITWACGIAIIQENWWIGVGTGDARDALKPCYRRKSEHVYEQAFDVHSEYLVTAIRHGMIGLLVFLTALLLPMFLYIRKRQYLFIAYISLLMICLLTETMLNRQLGALFWGFFSSIFLSSLSQYPEKSKS